MINLLFSVFFLLITTCPYLYAECLRGDCLNGQGSYIWRNGDKYEGNFANNNIEGLGTYTWVNGDKYIGDFKSNKINGFGSYSWKNGNEYKGKFIDGKATRKGIYKQGDKYIFNFPFPFDNEDIQDMQEYPLDSSVEYSIDPHIPFEFILIMLGESVFLYFFYKILKILFVKIRPGLPKIIRDIVVSLVASTIFVFISSLLDEKSPIFSFSISAVITSVLSKYDA